MALIILLQRTLVFLVSFRDNIFIGKDDCKVTLFQIPRSHDTDYLVILLDRFLKIRQEHG